MTTVAYAHALFHQVELPSGVRYTDLRVGGGQRPIKGYLVVVDYV
jgi:FKBP-type peptidyl-prolyl cis-trans isomerase